MITKDRLSKIRKLSYDSRLRNGLRVDCPDKVVDNIRYFNDRQIGYIIDCYNDNKPDIVEKLVYESAFLRVEPKVRFLDTHPVLDYAFRHSIMYDGCSLKFCDDYDCKVCYETVDVRDLIGIFNTGYNNQLTAAVLFMRVYNEVYSNLVTAGIRKLSNKYLSMIQRFVTKISNEYHVRFGTSRACYINSLFTVTDYGYCIYDITRGWKRQVSKINCYGKWCFACLNDECEVLMVNSKGKYFGVKFNETGFVKEWKRVNSDNASLLMKDLLLYIMISNLADSGESDGTKYYSINEIDFENTLGVVVNMCGMKHVLDDWYRNYDWSVSYTSDMHDE